MKRISAKMLIPVMIFILAIIAITSKQNLLKKYEVSSKDSKLYNEIIEGLIIDDLKVIINNKKDNYINYKNIKIGDLKDFQCNEGTESYTCKKDTDKIIIIKKDNSYIELFKDNKINKKYNNINKKEIIVNNNIESDIDLFGFIKETKKNNLLTSSNTIKQNYALKMFTINYIPKINNMYLLEGHIEGYIMNLKNNVKEANFKYKGSLYSITFINETYFTDDKIESILSTIE